MEQLNEAERLVLHKI